MANNILPGEGGGGLPASICRLMLQSGTSQQNNLTSASQQEVVWKMYRLKKIYAKLKIWWSHHLCHVEITKFREESNTKVHQRQFPQPVQSSLRRHSIPFPILFSHPYLALQTLFQTITVGPLLVSPYALHVPPISSSMIGHPNNIAWAQIMKLPIMQITSHVYYLLSLISKYTNCMILVTDFNKRHFTSSEFFSD